MAQGAGRGEKRTVGQRSRKLEQAFHSTVKYALRGSPMDEFETYFPEGSVSSETLKAVYDAYVQCLHQARVFIDGEFEEICQDANVADVLQTIDVLCAEQGFDGTRDASACALQGPLVARAATLKAKKQALERLRALKHETEGRNAQLEDQLRKKKEEAATLRARVSTVGQKLEEVTHSWQKK
ncbi:hypothetical protein M9435_000194 [Picochlorum sp. BPE23]|nr:hypothetical protein M9435_000194 [Picochlorum sp. BPE23]